MRSPIRRTPLLRTGEREYYKLENLQRTGSFKLRGAWHKVCTLAGKHARLVTASAGNHGSGLALAAEIAGLELTVFVPTGAPEIKRRKISDRGAHLIVVGEGYDEAHAAAIEHARAHRSIYISAYDDDDIIAGNGRSLAREILEQAGSVARVVAPVGGGGMIAGLAIELCPQGIEVVAAQPEANCAMYESMQRGRALTEFSGRPTLAEGCEGAVAERTFDVVRRFSLPFTLVSETEIGASVARCYWDHGLIIEPSAAVAVAAAKKLPEIVGDTVVVVSGGNIDERVLGDILALHPQQR